MEILIHQRSPPKICKTIHTALPMVSLRNGNDKIGQLEYVERYSMNQPEKGLFYQALQFSKKEVNQMQ